MWTAPHIATSVLGLSVYAELENWAQTLCRFFKAIVMYMNLINVGYKDQQIMGRKWELQNRNTISQFSYMMFGNPK